MKINLGCGRRKLENFVNIDKEILADPDIVWDIEKTPWPFLEPETVDEVMCSHILEHIGHAPATFLAVMQELYRVMKKGAVLTIKTPHQCSIDFWGDPTHVRPITPQMLSLFSRANCDKFLELNVANTPLAHYLGVDFELVHTNYNLAPEWIERAKNQGWSDEQLSKAQLSYNNVVNEVIMTVHKLPRS